ncbi:hypothetical protein BH24CHL6_BH24CHL6_15560 [soil metagenome]
MPEHSAVPPAPPPPAPSDVSITRLISERVLDSELAALLWVLLDSALPLVVSGPPASRPVELAAALDQLVAAGGRRNGHADRQVWLLDEDSLEAVFRHFSAAPLSLDPDQLRSLGLVLILRQAGGGKGRRLVAAHYIRPVERDAAGHLQRRPPALLAAHDSAQDRLEHFSWALTAELADRLSMGVAAFEAAYEQRSQLLTGLVGAGRLSSDDLRRAVGELSTSGPH